MDHADDLSQHISQSHNIAVIDCGATTTVVGKKWFQIFEKSLSEEDRHCLEELEEKNICHFKFGDGETMKSEVVKVIPVNMCGQNLSLIHI